jgi:serine/threonine protein kinase
MLDCLRRPCTYEEEVENDVCEKHEECTALLQEMQSMTKPALDSLVKNVTGSYDVKEHVALLKGTFAALRKAQTKNDILIRCGNLVFSLITPLTEKLKQDTKHRQALESQNRQYKTSENMLKVQNEYKDDLLEEKTKTSELQSQWVAQLQDDNGRMQQRCMLLENGAAKRRVTLQTSARRTGRRIVAVLYIYASASFAFFSRTLEYRTCTHPPHFKELFKNMSASLKLVIPTIDPASCLGGGEEGRVYKVSEKTTVKELVNNKQAAHELKIHDIVSRDKATQPYVVRMYSHRCSAHKSVDECLRQPLTPQLKKQSQKLGTCFATMEFAPFGDLKSVLLGAAHARLDKAAKIAAVCAMLKSVLQALVVVQEKLDFTHNDLHWENVLVFPGQVCKLYDFGFATLRTNKKAPLIVRPGLPKRLGYMRAPHAGYDQCELVAYMLEGDSSAVGRQAVPAELRRFLLSAVPGLRECVARPSLRPNPKECANGSPQQLLESLAAFCAEQAPAQRKAHSRQTVQFVVGQPKTSKTRGRRPPAAHNYELRSKHTKTRRGTIRR